MRHKIDVAFAVTGWQVEDIPHYLIGKSNAIAKLLNCKTEKCDLKAKAKKYRAAANLINAVSSKQ